MRYIFAATAIADDNLTSMSKQKDIGPIWGKGDKVICKSDDLQCIVVTAKNGFWGLDPDEFFSYFETDFKLDSVDPRWLSEESRDAIYRAVWYEHVKEDIVGMLEDREDRADDDVIEQAAYLYVYEGDYDCNESYWSQLEAVLDKAGYRLRSKEENR